MAAKPRIAHFSGPNATIQNSAPLVTSNKARRKYGLPLKTGPDGTPLRFDVLRAQRLAAPVTLYVEQFSAHPLERDAAELYGPPDGYLDASGKFYTARQSPSDVPVYEITIQPEDGLYPLPYMARRADGSPWEDDVAFPGAPPSFARQPFYPDGSRSFEEIDRGIAGVSDKGVGNLIGSRADVDFYRPMPPGGYTKGLPAALRTDRGTGDIPSEVRGRDFFPYRPVHISASPPMPALARITNFVQRVMATGRYEGAIWTQGSPRIEETMYWFNLLIDTPAPLCGNAAQRPHGEVSADGPKNLIDSVDYITSRVWAGPDGRNVAGMVLIQEQQVFAAREVQKGDARPGGYTTTGGHGGMLGAVGCDIPAVLLYVPTYHHTYRSAVNVTRLPVEVDGVRKSDGKIATVRVRVKDASGELTEAAIPKVTIVKDGSYTVQTFDETEAHEVDLLAQIEHNLRSAPLAGFVVEGLSPYGTMTSTVRNRLMMRAVASGMPVVAVGRGNAEGFAWPRHRVIGGRNLTSTKARLLLMACLMKLGTYLPAADPEKPTDAELAAIRKKIAAYQEIFDTH